MECLVVDEVVVGKEEVVGRGFEGHRGKRKERNGQD